MKRINEAHPKDFVVSLRNKEPPYPSIRDSVSSLRSTGREKDVRYRPSSTQLQRKVHSVTSVNICGDRELRNGNDRKIATLPRGHVTEIEEALIISRRTSISNGIPADIG